MLHTYFLYRINLRCHSLLTGQKVHKKTQYIVFYILIYVYIYIIQDISLYNEYKYCFTKLHFTYLRIPYITITVFSLLYIRICITNQNAYRNIITLLYHLYILLYKLKQCLNLIVFVFVTLYGSFFIAKTSQKIVKCIKIN